MHLRSLERFDFDSVLLPYNHALLANPVYRDDVEALLERCTEREVAVQTIKSIARRRWIERPRGARSWYEPIADEAAMGRAVAYVLARPQLFLNSSSDFALLPAVLAAAAQVSEAPSEEALVADEAALGISPLFDGDALERI
jgi:hypothetical protein